MPPANDLFANATTISGDSGTTTVDTVGAGFQTGEPNHRQGHTVWYKWTATANGYLNLDTASTPLPRWDTIIDVYTGTALTALTLVRSNDDGWLQQFNFDNHYFGTSLISTLAVTAGVTYYIRVDNWTWTDPTTGDVFTDRSNGVLRWWFHAGNITSPSWGGSEPTLEPGIVDPTFPTQGNPWSLVFDDNTIIGHIYLGTVEAAWDADVGGHDVTVYLTDAMAGSYNLRIVETSGLEYTLPAFVLYPGPWIQDADVTSVQNTLGYYASDVLNTIGDWSDSFSGVGDRTLDNTNQDIKHNPSFDGSRQWVSFDLVHCPVSNAPVGASSPSMPSDAWSGPQNDPVDPGELRYPIHFDVFGWDSPPDLSTPTGPYGVCAVHDPVLGITGPTGYPSDASVMGIKVPETDYTLPSSSWSATPHLTGGTNWKTPSQMVAWTTGGSAFVTNYPFPVEPDGFQPALFTMDFDLSDADTNGGVVVVLVLNYYINAITALMPPNYGLSVSVRGEARYDSRPAPYRWFYTTPQVGGTAGPWVVGALSIQ